MKITIASDHAGYKLKEELKKYLQELGHEAEDLGTDSEESVDYPDYGKKAAKQVASSKNKGILICGSGIGMSIVANKVKGIRAALCHNEHTVKAARQHNDANILCLGARDIDSKTAKKLTKIFLETEASSEERHKRRVSKIE
ncbi:ribose 5-phosphate isomerase B [Candidatus Woesearchaeota archaeon]|nr:ribose 5-phosphate isomerase B [Candidatus Woesearchaeota archaeon]